MKDNKLTGYIFLALCAAILLFAFYLAYNLFTGSLSNAASPPPASGTAQSAGSGISGLIEGILGGAAATFVYLFIAVIVLLVMASIGGRFVKYGMGLLNLYWHPTKGSKEEVTMKARAKQERKAD